MILFPERKIISNEEIAQYPQKSFAGKIHIVHNKETMQQAVDYLQHCPILGFDTETRPAFSKYVEYNVALLQLSDNKHAFLFQLQKTGISPELAEILCSPNVLKVGVAVHDDVIKLKKMCKRKMHGFIDLQIIAKELEIENLSLKKLTAIVLGFRISKKQQLSNWEAEPLSFAQQLYASTDAWVGFEMYKALEKYLNKES